MIKQIVINGVTYINMYLDDAIDQGVMDADRFGLALIEQQNSDLFASEKNIALQIISDYQLGLHSITDQDITDTRLYIQSIEPLSAASSQRTAMPRPQIFSRYKKNPYDL